MSSFPLEFSTRKKSPTVTSALFSKTSGCQQGPMALDILARMRFEARLGKRTRPESVFLGEDTAVMEGSSPPVERRLYTIYSFVN